MTDGRSWIEQSDVDNGVPDGPMPECQHTNSERITDVTSLCRDCWTTFHHAPITSAHCGAGS